MLKNALVDEPDEYENKNDSLIDRDERLHIEPVSLIGLNSGVMLMNLTRMRQVNMLVIPHLWISTALI